MIMPRYFKQTHYKSFQRQLHIYGFLRINDKGMLDSGAYYHDKFIKGQKQLSLRMVRQKIKGPNAHDAHHLKPDPDFYAASKGSNNAIQGSSSMPSNLCGKSSKPMDRSLSTPVVAPLSDTYGWVSQARKREMNEWRHPTQNELFSIPETTSSANWLSPVPVPMASTLREEEDNFRFISFLICWQTP